MDFSFLQHPLFNLSVALLLPLAFIVISDIAQNYLFYGTPAYKAALAKSKELESRLDRSEKEESSLKEAKSVMTSSMWPFAITTFSVILMWWSSSSLLAGQVVASLPFEPPALFGIRGWFHGAIPPHKETGEIDWTESAYLPIVFCSNLFWRFFITSFFPSLSGAPSTTTSGQTDLMNWVNRLQQQQQKLQKTPMKRA
jgi:hypothetical protein